MNTRMINFLNTTLTHCRSELAREKPKGDAFNLDVRVIVDDLREQARSYKRFVTPVAESAASKAAD